MSIQSLYFLSREERKDYAQSLLLTVTPLGGGRALCASYTLLISGLSPGLSSPITRVAPVAPVAGHGMRVYHRVYLGGWVYPGCVVGGIPRVCSRRYTPGCAIPTMYLRVCIPTMHLRVYLSQGVYLSGCTSPRVYTSQFLTLLTGLGGQGLGFGKNCQNGCFPSRA